MDCGLICPHTAKMPIQKSSPLENWNSCATGVPEKGSHFTLRWWDPDVFLPFVVKAGKAFLTPGSLYQYF